MKYFAVLFILTMLSACSASASPQTATTSPTTSGPAVLSTETAQPLEPATPPPTLVSATVESVKPSPTSTAPMPTPTEANYLQTVDLSALVEAWNSRDVNAIRALYTRDARYFPQTEIQNLADEQLVDVAVSDPTFAARVAEHEGMTLRILGEPLMMYDKLVAYLYRWELATEGYDGAGLLRYEQGKIFLHSAVESTVLTPNPTEEAAFLTEVDLDGMLQAWKDARQDAAREIYAEDAIIFSDEDLAQAAWRDFSKPPSMDQLLSQFAGWNPAILGEPLRLGDLAIFAWHWERFDYPMGYGVRLVHFTDGKIDTDIRYAIRPWEANGAPFMQP